VQHGRAGVIKKGGGPFFQETFSGAREKGDNVRYNISQSWRGGRAPSGEEDRSRIGEGVIALVLGLGMLPVLRIRGVYPRS
jgi:hypothetical protein